MSLEKHTPGPWRIGNAGRAIFPPAGIGMIADCFGFNNSRANARLIAAAPDLLAAAAVALHTIGRGTAEECDKARSELYAAITKATGAK